VSTQNPVQPVIQADPLTKLIRIDLPADIQRLKAAKLSPEMLQSELVGTVMFYLRSLGEHQIQVRDWAANFLFGIQGELESHDDRLDEVEGDSSQTTQIEQEDADKLLLYLAGSKWLIEEAQKTQVDPEARQKLAELLTLGNECEELIRQNVLIEVPDDEDEEGEEGEESEEGEDEEGEDKDEGPVQ